MTTLTPEQIERLYDKMVEYWGGAAPNPEYQPKQFQYCVTLFKYYCPDAWEKALAAPVEDEIVDIKSDSEIIGTLVEGNSNGNVQDNESSTQSPERTV